MPDFQTLPGFRDFYPEDCALRNFIFDRCHRTAEAFGFEEYDAPLVEPVELFTAKSGPEIVAQLFNFADKGGRQISLRPELTPSLAKMVGSRAPAMKKPIKWFSIGEQFRYERPQKGRLRSFYQFNADLLGDDSIGADAEIMALAIQTLRNFGLTRDDFHLRLSDRQLWALFIGRYVADESSVFPILGIIDKSEREEETKSIEALKKICPSVGEKLFDDIKRLKSIRSLADMRIFFQEFQMVDKAVNVRLDAFSRLLERLHAFELLDFIAIDFGIVRGLAYYTGFVFEIFERCGQSRALAGGGRYDDLIGKLGYANLSAVGFAIGDVTLSKILEEKNLIPEFKKNIQCFVVYSEQTEQVALKQIMLLRQNNVTVDYCLNPLPFAKQLKLAAQIRAKYAIIFGEDELGNNCVRIKHMASHSEKVAEISIITEIISNDKF
ncbi:MAG: histidine--tRNA ligase [Puniceicoccales bacterium]|jgi:histidyl-tRNA synthetase|nr:histidine--tRNA ligase [Puniceicoccales bacterium]